MEPVSETLARAQAAIDGHQTLSQTVIEPASSRGSHRRRGSPQRERYGWPRYVEDRRAVQNHVRLQPGRDGTLALSPRHSPRSPSLRGGSPSYYDSPGPTRRVVRHGLYPDDVPPRAHLTADETTLENVDQPLAPLEPTANLPGYEGRGNEEDYGLRGAVHAAHGQFAVHDRNGNGADRHAPVTYLIATYTGKLTDNDKKRPWYRALDQLHLDQMAILGNDLAHTQAEVCIELKGADGRRSGRQRLVHAGDHHHHAFRQNMVDEFAVSCEDLGDVSSIELTLDSAGVDPDPDVDTWLQALWKLDKVVVSCIVHKKQAVRGMACCGAPSGDHAKKTGKSKGVIWTFVPPAGGEWVGEKGYEDPADVQRRIEDDQDDLTVLNDQLRGLKARMAEVEREIAGKNRQIEGKKDRVKHQEGVLAGAGAGAGAAMVNPNAIEIRQAREKWWMKGPLAAPTGA